MPPYLQIFPQRPNNLTPSAVTTTTRMKIVLEARENIGDLNSIFCQRKKRRRDEEKSPTSCAAICQFFVQLSNGNLVSVVFSELISIIFFSEIYCSDDRIVGDIVSAKLDDRFVFSGRLLKVVDNKLCKGRQTNTYLQ